MDAASVSLNYRKANLPLTQVRKSMKGASLREKTGSLVLNMLGLILLLDIQ